MTGPASAPLTAEHLRRKACVYVRQSSDFQVRNHLERQQLQYALADHARELGFRDVEVIDEDQGTSGAGVRRTGFDRLVSAVCRGEVGLVLALEASRLARNGREWHTLLDFCGIVGCLVGDRRQLYDPAVADDRLFLGMKGSFAEAELATFRQRSLESRQALAERGELFTHVPAGYEKVDKRHIEMTPDQRQRDALRLVFRKFAELRSVRQVWRWLRAERVPIPVRHRNRKIVWKVPTESSLYSLLHNPIYAGAYAYGRRRQETRIENGRKRVRGGIMQWDPEEWTVLLRDRHAAYITWEEYERNQAVIAGHRTKVRGAVREGRALLAGRLRCGHCARRMQVRDNGRAVGYECPGETGANGGTCFGFGAVRADAAVGAAVLEAVQPLGVEAALEAWAERGAEAEAKQRLARQALEAARYRSRRAWLQFDDTEVDYPNVRTNLKALWEGRLEEERACEERLARLQAAGRREAPGPAERAAYLSLGADLERAWQHERAQPALRKAVLRAALVEITARREGERIRLLLHWKGGDHSELAVRRNKTGQHRWSTDKETVELVRELARSLSDAGIAGLLNRLGRKTAKGHSWTRGRVRSLRNSYGIAVYRPGEREERGELVLAEAAERLGVAPWQVYRLIRSGVLPARQACKGAPWLIAAEALERPEVRDWLAGKRPVDSESESASPLFSTT